MWKFNFVISHMFTPSAFVMNALLFVILSVEKSVDRSDLYIISSHINTCILQLSVDMY